MIPQHGTLTLSAGRLKNNLAVIQQRLNPATRMAVLLKANAYGHGAKILAPLLKRAGVEWGCVYCWQEAEELTDCGLTLLVLAPVAILTPAKLPAIALHPDVILNVTDAASARHLAALVPADKRLRVHVQVDTGLTRVGVSVAEAPGLLAAIEGLPRLRLEGIFSHLSHGEVVGHPTLVEQHRRLIAVAEPVKRRRPEVLVHLQNSGGAASLGDVKLDLVRVGIAAFGLQPDAARPIAELLPVAQLVAPILTIHERPEGTGVGYNHLFVTKGASRLAIVPVGYGDGYPRALSQVGVVQVNGQTVPVVGRVSMDQIIVDVTGVAAEVGDEVVVISRDAAAANSIEGIARQVGTINYEIATGFGSRLVRTVVD